MSYISFGDKVAKTPFLFFMLSTVGNTANGSTGNTTPNTTTPNQCTVREQDRFMPMTNVIRIMRKVLPPHAKISDDAKVTVQECVSEFISFITSEANDRCQHEQRRTVTAEDVLWAMKKLGFDHYVDLLTPFLRKYRTMEGDHRGSIGGEPSSLRRNSGSSVLNPYGSGVADPHGFRYQTINNQQYGIYDGVNMGNYYYPTSGYGGSAVSGGDGSGGASGTSRQSDSIDGFRSAANYK